MSDDLQLYTPGSKYTKRKKGVRRKLISENDKRTYLEGLELGLTIREASERAGHPPSSFEWHAANRPEFKEQKYAAMAVGTDRLEQEARRRAVEGWLEPVTGKVAPGIDGQVIGPDGEPMWVRKYDSRLLEVLLKGRRPEYRESQRVDITNQTLNVTVEDRSAALEEVAKVLREVGASVGEDRGAAGEVISGAGLLLAESEDL